MSDDGYTLVEVLAALIIIGLAIGGLTQAMHVIGLTQRAATQAATEAQSLRTTRAGLAGLFDREGPFVGDQEGQFVGGASEARFDCGGSQTCGAMTISDGKTTDLAITTRSGAQPRLALPTSQTVSFTYGGDQGTSDVWPPSSDQRETLRWVALSARGNGVETRPLASVRIWREEAPGCVFDIIAQTCRASAP